MYLSDLKIKKAKAEQKPYRLSDGNSLYVLVSPTGTKSWQVRYSWQGKEKISTLGKYPVMQLHAAREARDQILRLLAEGICPQEEKKKKQMEKKASQRTFKESVDAWFAYRKGTCTDDYLNGCRRKFEMYVFPALGNMPLAQITPKDLLRCLQAMEARDLGDSTHRVKSLCNQVFDFAIGQFWVEKNPALPLKKSLKSVPKRHFAAFTTEADARRLMQSILSYQGLPQVQSALRLMAYVFVRCNELCGMQWQEIEWEKKQWRIPAERMKMKTTHIVPLSHQALTLLQELKNISYTKSKYVFPSARGFSRPISNNTLRTALRIMGFTNNEMTAHGFRAMASTLLNEQGFNRDWIERQLAHCPRDHVRAAYNHADYILQRRKMMQKWSDYLDQLKVLHQHPSTSINLVKSI